MWFESERVSTPGKNESLRSAAGAILAHGLIHQRVQFGTRQGNFVGFILAAVASFRKFRPAARRRTHVIPDARGKPPAHRDAYDKTAGAFPLPRKSSGHPAGAGHPYP